MIRWKRLLTRLILIVLFVALILVAANPLLKLGIIHSGESITGSRLEIDRVRSSFSDGVLTLYGCTAAHPIRPTHNLFEARAIELNFDRDALSERRLLVKRATIDGLRVGTRRGTSGVLGQNEPSRYAAVLADEFAQSGQEWLGRANRQLERGERFELESVAWARRMLEHFPQQMTDLQNRAEDVEQRLNDLKCQLDEAGENPLRNLESYLVAIAEAEQLGRKMTGIRGDVGRLEQQLLMDQEKLVAVQGEDGERLERDIEVLGADPDEFSEYLLGPEVGSWVAEAIGWIHWGNHFLPDASARAKREGARGEDIWFSGITPRPDVQIENLVLRGMIPFADQAVSFEGRVIGLSSSPQLTENATELIIQTTNERPLLVQAKLDHTPSGTENEVLLNLPSYRQGQRVLGNDAQFAIDVKSTTSHIWMELKIVRNSLVGKLIVKQRPTGLSVATRHRVHGDHLTRLIESILDHVERIDIEATLSGTLDHPVWDVKSNLGAELAVSLRNAIQHELIERRRAILNAAKEDSQREVKALRHGLAELKSQLLERLDAGRQQIAQLKHTIALRVEETDGVLDPDSPLREVFRR